MRKKKKSKERSKAYYQGPEGKRKKQAINQTRKNADSNSSLSDVVTEESSDYENDDSAVDYIQMLLSSIHGCPQDKEKIKSLYNSFDDSTDKKMRQQGLDSNSS